MWLHPISHSERRLFMQETPGAYTKRILSYQKGKDPLKIQRSTVQKIERLIKGVSRTRLIARPAPKKWSAAEILAHLSDAELVTGFRLRMIIGANRVPIQAFDQDVWAKTFKYRNRNPHKSLETFRALRDSNLLLLNSISRTLWNNYGMHQERGKETVKRLVEMMAGHDINHTTQIERIVRKSSKK
jgi:DinB superfamily